MITFKAEPRKYADKILVVESGHVVRELVYEQMLRQDITPSWESRNQAGISQSEVETPKSKIENKASQVAERNEISDLTRKTGDRAVYGYYFGAIGWRKMACFVAFTVVHIFGATFGGKCSRNGELGLSFCKS